MPSAGALKLEGLVVQMNMHPSLNFLTFSFSSLFMTMIAEATLFVGPIDVCKQGPRKK